MTIWAIADIHASRTDPETGSPIKSMDMFGESWVRHVERLETAWKESVRAEDTVIVAGDIDWALYLDDARETLDRLGRWNGTKVIIRGNHDYWWSSKSTNRVRRSLPAGVLALHNDAIQREGFNICGAKGSPVPGGLDWTDEDSRLLDREVQRLRQSLANREPSLPTIVVLHFPPFIGQNGQSLYREVIEEAGAAACVYGHLHGVSSRAGPQGKIGGVYYHLVAGDYLGFRPARIAANGRLIAEQAREWRGRMNANPEGDELRDLAERIIDEKVQDGAEEDQARELFDVPTETDAQLAQDQDDGQ
jgi:uncharacterized protein